MKLKKSALIYDISNIAYVIADTGDDSSHILHKVRDICEEGNLDRVSRILGLAYARLLTILSPVLNSPGMNLNHDFTAVPHDYEFNFRKGGNLKYLLTTEHKLHIKELCREFMVCFVLADWLSITLPQAADSWKFRTDFILKSLSDIITSITANSQAIFRRRLSPF